MREMILYTAQMKLPHTMAKSDKVKATEEIMDRLGLSLARDTLIGGQSVKGISGGQVSGLSHQNSLRSRELLFGCCWQVTEINGMVTRSPAP